MWNRGAWRRPACWIMPWRGRRHHFCLQGGPDGRAYHLRCGGRVEEFSRREKSYGWTSHHNHYQEPDTRQVEDDGRHRHHLDLVVLISLCVLEHEICSTMLN